MNTEPMVEKSEVGEDLLYATVGAASLAGCIKQVLRNLLSAEESNHLNSSEAIDLLKAEVCTVCRRHAFMVSDGECSQACDLIDQVLSDANIPLTPSPSA